METQNSLLVNMARFLLVVGFLGAACLRSQTVSASPFAEDFIVNPAAEEYILNELRVQLWNCENECSAHTAKGSIVKVSGSVSAMDGRKLLELAHMAVSEVPVVFTATTCLQKSVRSNAQAEGQRLLWIRLRRVKIPCPPATPQAMPEHFIRCVTKVLQAASSRALAMGKG